MFRRVDDVRNQLEPTNYFSSLDGYLKSLQTINPSMEQNLSIKTKDRFQMGIPPPRASLEVKQILIKCLKIMFSNKFRNIFQCYLKIMKQKK